MEKNKISNNLIGFLGWQFLILIVDIIILTSFQIIKLWILVLIIYISVILVTILYYYFKIRPHIKESCHNEAKLNRALYELIQRSSSLSTSEQLYKEILRKTIQAIPNASKGCILLLENENVLTYKAVIGYDEDALKKTFLYMEQTFLYIESKGNIKKSVVIDDPFEYDKKREQTDNLKKVVEASPYLIKTTLSTPIFINNKLYGMINIDSETKDAFTKQDIKTMEFFVFEVSNVIKLYNSLEDNKFLLHRDVLTGIYNRRYFNNTLMEKLKTIKENEFFSLVSFDLNNLKITNDKYGHECGDKMLIHFTKGIKEFVTDKDVFARYGGDEFLLLIENKEPTSVKSIIESTNEYFRNNPLVYKEEQLIVSFSYGISSYPEDGNNMDAIIKKADFDMYSRKRDYHLLILEG